MQQATQPLIGNVMNVIADLRQNGILDEYQARGAKATIERIYEDWLRQFDSPIQTMNQPPGGLDDSQDK